jgi:hypothetical protein
MTHYLKNYLQINNRMKFQQYKRLKVQSILSERNVAEQDHYCPLMILLRMKLKLSILNFIKNQKEINYTHLMENVKHYHLEA